MKRTWLSVIGIVMLALAFVSGPTMAQVTLTFSTPDPLSSPITQAAQHFAELVREKSGGSVEVRVYPDGVLFGGDPSAAVRLLGSGVLDMLALSSSLYTSFEPKFNAVSVPYMFTSTDEVDDYLSGPLGQELLQSLERLDIKGLGFWLRPFRQITNSQRPLTQLSDFEGLRLRVPNNPLFVEFFRALGVNPTPMSFSEVYNALQLRTVDGQENPLGVPVSARFYEVQKYVTISNHIADAWVIGVSASKWNSLSPEVQSVIVEAVKETAAWKRAADERDDAEYLELMQSHGMEVNWLTPEVVAQLKEVAQSLAPTFSELVGEDFYNRTIEYLQR